MINILRRSSNSLFLLTLANILFYVPISVLTKMSSKGLFDSLNGRPVTAFEMLPLYALGNVIVQLAFTYGSGWLKYTENRRVLGIRVPLVRRHTFAWGFCTIGQVITVLWVFAFDGISIVFASLLMKGGMLMLGPVADVAVRTNKRRIYWPSCVGALFSLFALITASLRNVDLTITLACVIDILLYLASVFLKLVVMSRWAKTNDIAEKKRFLVEGQTAIAVLLTAVVLIMSFLGLFWDHKVLRQVLDGFTVLPSMGFVVPPIMLGAFGILSGIIASLILLDRRENTFCVTLVQSSSILAGVLGAVFLAVFYGQPDPTPMELLGVIIIFIAISFLSYRGKIERRHLAKLSQ